MLRRQRNLVKIMYKTSKYDVNVQHDHPSMDLRSKPKVKLKNKLILQRSIIRLGISPYF